MPMTGLLIGGTLRWGASVTQPLPEADVNGVKGDATRYNSVPTPGETLNSAVTTELAPAPTGDPNYVNVRLQIDPNWPHNIGSGTASFYAHMVFPFVDQTEEGFSENVSVNYAPTDIVGRDEQYQTYTGTGNRTIPLTFRFMGHGINNSGMTDSELEFLQQQNIFTAYNPSLDEVVKPVRWLESLQHAIPDAATGISYAPPPLLLFIGNLFAGRVIMTECSIKWDGPFDPGTMMPHAATVNCVFTVVRNALSNEAQYTGINTPEYSRFVEFPTQGPVPVRGT